MCLAVPKFRVIRVETDRTIRLVQPPIDLGHFAQNNEILVNKLRFIPVFYQISMRQQSGAFLRLADCTRSQDQEF